MSDSTEEIITPLKKRHIFYVTGFDPRGAIFYFSLLKREASISRKRNQSQFRVSELSAESEYISSCQLIFEDSEKFTSDYHLLSIIDLITPYFRQPIWRSLWQSLVTFCVIASSALPYKCLKHSVKFGLFILYPFITILLLILASWGLSTSLCEQLAPHETNAIFTAFFFCIFYVFLWLLKRSDQFHYIFYLLGDFYFSQTAVRNKNEALNLRLELFSKKISRTLTKIGAENEEVLIVGHSSGGLLATQLAALLCDNTPIDALENLSLLTLGNQASLGFLKNTERFRDDINTIIKNPDIVWRDVFAPQDVISSGKLDLVNFFGAPSSTNFQPMSARLKESMTDESYKSTAKKFFKIHMQYLRSSETGRGFDYLQLLNSPLRLRHYTQK